MNITERSERCVNCKHWIAEQTKTESVEVGQCRRYPPRIVVLPDDEGVICIHPTTGWKDSCGEFVSRGDA